ncbi:S-layer homology domain-containing protein [Paenibacillus sp. FSL R10-2734]|uniref:S-layer homology domain-containing protein n=1 Tax=Paenibacillus sp. FSL R10-2734 TaxID=2954691 RepID=UPI0030DD6290
MMRVYRRGRERGTVEALRQMGVLQGRSGVKFAPREEASRAEVLAMILRWLDMRLICAFE